MKIFIYVIAGIFLFVGLICLVLSVSSRKQPDLGTINGLLRPCPNTPNCVCSEYPLEDAFIKPLSYSIAHDDAWLSLKQVVAKTGGLLILKQDRYLRAQYVTPILRFIDDVEFRMDEDKHLIHVRSASRVGHSDLGENRRRVERLRKVFEAL